MKILNKVQNAISSGKFEEAKELLKQQTTNISFNTTIGPIFFPQKEASVDLSYADLQKDYGSGRVSKGLIFLELLSLYKKGKNLQSVLLFDRIPQYANVRLLDTAQTNEEKSSFVSASLGVKNLSLELKKYNRDMHEEVELKLVEIFEKVNNGQFLRKNNDNILSFLRKIAKTLKTLKERLVV